jgi:hypothetical protein
MHEAVLQPKCSYFRAESEATQNLLKLSVMEVERFDPGKTEKTSQNSGNFEMPDRHFV